MKVKNFYLAFRRIGFLFILLIIFSCIKREEPEIIYPKSYFPAYPGSYWVYNNGQTVKVDQNYHLHSYENNISSNNKTEEVYVPRINGQYVYEYSITQNSTLIPLKKLLSETADESWIVDYWNGKNVSRKIVSINDSIAIVDTIFGIDTTFKSVISVIEYSEEFGEENWFSKEYYVKYIGLIRKETNNYQDTLDPVIEFYIVDYSINHKFSIE